MDSNDLEKERGITILSKNTAITWKDYKINIVDTPGHADFGGEVERVLSMVDSVLLLVDAVEGPMPQTKFVTQKAFEANLNPIVVINKIDRKDARPDWVINEVFDLFDSLGASDEQLDFPIVYTSAIKGISGLEPSNMQEGMQPLFEAIINKVSAPKCDPSGPFQMQVSSLDYSSFVGAIAIGRITRGKINRNSQVKIIDTKNEIRSARILQILGYDGLERKEQESASAGDIVAVTGIERPYISDTICDPDNVEALPSLSVDEPTVQMILQVNSSPFVGKDGKFLTSRQIRERLDKELLHNVALKVSDTEDPDKFLISGRGELHLSVLLETMRREGFEFAISKPMVIIKKDEQGNKTEPYEDLVIDIDEKHQGAIVEYLNTRKGEISDMLPDGKGRIKITYFIPTRGIIGFRQWFITTTSGSGICTHVFSCYGEYKGEIKNKRKMEL